MPNDMHAGIYAATEHLMKAVAQLKSADDGVKVVDTMKAIPTDDPLFGKGIIRVDGRKLHPMYLYKAKTPVESKYDWESSSWSQRSNPRTLFVPWTRAGARSSRHEDAGRVGGKTARGDGNSPTPGLLGAENGQPIADASKHCANGHSFLRTGLQRGRESG